MIGKGNTRHFSVGLIGCGYVARRYAAAINDDLEELDLRGVWDVVPEVARLFAREFRVECLPSLNEFLASQFDLVCICTPNDTHYSLVQEALQAGLHVLVEHPLALNEIEGIELCRLADERRRYLFVTRQRRFLPSVQALRTALEEGILGSIRTVKATVCWNRELAYFGARSWRVRPENGGVLQNQASHFLDILLYLLGEPGKVYGIVGNIRHDIPVEDSFKGTLTFPHFVVDFSCTTAAPAGHNRTQLAITGERGHVTLGGKAWENLAFRDHENAPLSLPMVENGEPQSGDHAGYLERVRLRLSGLQVEVVETVEGLRSVRTIEQIYKTARRDTAALQAHFLPLFNGRST